MGLFGSPTPFDTEVENVTSEQKTTEDWGLILTICDKAGKTSEDAKNYLRAILRRLNNVDPHIGLHAVTLLDACVSNCGKVFHVEVASREFETEYCKLLKKSNLAVKQRLKQCLKKWAENEFKSDSELDLIPSLYNRLRESGTDFTTEAPLKKKIVLSKDPNVVQSQDEEDQIAQAIELSLKETATSKGHPTTSTPTPNTSLYPTNLTNASYSMGTIPNQSAKEPRRVRALYDFEAAEDNELTFTAGEIIVVNDDSDTNWWKGSNQRGEGLFPANFVSADLSAAPEPTLSEIKEKVESAEEKELEPDPMEINEEKIDRLLHLLHEADSTNPDSDNNEMLKLEREVNGMGPLIDTELEQVDRKHAQLTQLSSDLVEALNLYHTLMREPTYAPITPPMNKMPYGYPTQPLQTAPPMYNGNMPPQHQPQFARPYSAVVQERQPQQLPGQGLPPPHMMMPPHMMHAPPGTLPHPHHGQTQLPPPHIGQMHSLPPMQTQAGLPNYGVPNPPPGYIQNPLPQMNGATGQPSSNFNSPPNPNTHIM